MTYGRNDDPPSFRRNSRNGTNHPQLRIKYFVFFALPKWKSFPEGENKKRKLASLCKTMGIPQPESPFPAWLPDSATGLPPAGAAGR